MILFGYYLLHSLGDYVIIITSQPDFRSIDFTKIIVNNM